MVSPSFWFLNIKRCIYIHIYAYFCWCAFSSHLLNPYWRSCIGGYRDIPHNCLQMHKTPLGGCTIYQSSGHCSNLSGVLWGILFIYLFLVRKADPELTSVPIFFCFFFFNFIFPFSPQSPLVHSCVFLVVGPSSCGMWDTASAWLDEQCHVRGQDPNRRNPGLLKWSTWT